MRHVLDAPCSILILAAVRRRPERPLDRREPVWICGDRLAAQLRRAVRARGCAAADLWSPLSSSFRTCVSQSGTTAASADRDRRSASPTARRSWRAAVRAASRVHPGGSAAASRSMASLTALRGRRARPAAPLSARSAQGCGHRPQAPPARRRCGWYPRQRVRPCLRATARPSPGGRPRRSPAVLAAPNSSLCVGYKSRSTRSGRR